jgi:hypothetical protein
VTPSWTLLMLKALSYSSLIEHRVLVEAFFKFDILKQKTEELNSSFS